MRLFLCKIFARWVYKDTNARHDDALRCFFVLDGTAVGNSPLILDNPSRRQLTPSGFVVDTFVEMLAPMGEIVEKKGTRCRRLI
jgi:hypothetical protein